MRNRIGAFFVLVIANAVVSFAVWGQHATAQAYKNSAGMFADVSETKSPSAALMVAQNVPMSAAIDAQSIKTIGVCTEADVSVMGSISVVPGADIEGYQRDIEKLSDWMVPPEKQTVTVLENTVHGVLTKDTQYGLKDRYIYTPASGYTGTDTATFLLDTGTRQFKLVYSIKVYDSGDGSNQTGCDYPNVWRMSLNQNNVDPSAVAFGLPDALSNQLLKNVNVSLNIASLPDGKLGETTGTSITLDDNGAGYGWFNDPTPGPNKRKGRAALGAVVSAGLDCRFSGYQVFKGS
ncbi:MAG: hypothetical protein ABUS47_08750 [Steroidobacter sp.]